MKKSMLALVAAALLMVSFSMLWADTVTISEGSLYYGSFAPVYNGQAYTYSQQIYYQSQLNFIGMINKIRFYYYTGTTVNSDSWTIYMGETPKTAFSNNTDWIPVASMTQVFSGNVTFPGAGGWMEITLDTDFPYTNTDNLVIAVDENTAGSATAQWLIYDSTIANRTMGRATSVNVDPNLPGTANLMSSYMNFIQLDYVTTAPPNPSAFVATPVSLSQIDLGWTKNVNDDDVMIAVSSTGVFGIPIDGTSYLVNDPVIGGGTVIYNGPGTTHQHMGLTQNTQYFYKAWSVDNTTAYSTGVNAVAATLMPPIAVFPWLETYETSSNTVLQWRTVPGSGNWALSQNVSAWGVGSRSTTAQFFSIPGATPFDLVSPTLDTSGLNNPMLSFDYSYATYTGGEVDQMDVYYSLDDGASYTLLLAMPGGPTGILNTGGTVNISFIPTAGQWASQTLSLPPNVNKIMFRATSDYGNNLYLDNVQVFKTWDIPANVLTDIGGTDILSQVNLDLIPGVSVGDPVFASLNNLGSLNSSLVYGLSGSGMTDLDFTVGAGTWYGVLFVGANMFIGFPNPLTGPGTISFYNVDFDAKGDVYVLLGEGADPTLPVELSSFAATLTADIYVNVAWVAASETNHLGYNVLRGETDMLGNAIQLNQNVITEGSAIGTQVSYSFLDTEVEANGIYYYWLESLDLGGTSAVHGPISILVTGEPGDPGTPPLPPTVTKLMSAYPNPFNPSTNIRYSLMEAGKVRIEIYNVKGQMIRSFENNHNQPGYFQIMWDGKDASGRAVSSGIYLYRMISGHYRESRKMVLAK